MHNVYMDGFTVYIHADVEWLNEHMHEKIKLNLTEKSKKFPNDLTVIRTGEHSIVSRAL